VNHHHENTDLRGDWGYFERHSPEARKAGWGPAFRGYTFRHRLRLWIGVVGYLGDGEWSFRGAPYGSLRHRFLNWIL
jgi:hypothetical protein